MSSPSLRLGWPLYAGMLVAGAAAVVASASTLSNLAHAAGWSSWTPWLLPAALDIGGSAGGWCWLRPDVPEPARRFGRTVAFTGAIASLIGNAAGHLLATGYLHPGPQLVVIVGAVPAIVLVALAHLAALLATPTTRPAEQADHHQPDDNESDQSDNQTNQDDDSSDNDAMHQAAEEHQEPNPTADTRQTILRLLQEHPRTVADLTRATGRSRSTVNGHLAALTKTGTISRDPAKRYHPIARPHLISQPAKGSHRAGSRERQPEQQAAR